MKAVKLIFKAALVLFLILTITIIGGGYYVIHHPKKVWSLIEKKVLPKDLKISWSDLDFQSSRESTWVWSPSLDFQNLCIVKASPDLEICFDDFKIRARVTLEKVVQPHVEVESLYALSTHENHFGPTHEKHKAQKTDQDLYETVRGLQAKLQSYSRWPLFHQVELAVGHFEIRSSEGKPLVIRGLIKSQELRKSFQTEVAVERAPGLFLRAKGEVHLQDLLEARGPFADFSVLLDLPKVKGHIPELRLSWGPEKNLVVNASGEIKAAGAKIPNQVQLRLGPRALVADIQASVLGLKKPFQKLKPLHAKVEIPQERGSFWSSTPATYQVSGRLPVFFFDRKMRSKIQSACHCVLPEELAVQANGKADLKKYFHNQDGEVTTLQAQVESVSNSLFSTRNSLQVSVSREKGGWKLEPFIDSQFVLQSYQGLALALRAQKILIPAPFANLNGTVTLSAHGPVGRSEDSWKFPFLLVTNLSSPNQKVDLKSDGFFEFFPDTHLIAAEVDVLLKNIVLQLPPLDPVYGIPKITPDKRIEVRPPKVARQKPKKQKFKLKLAVHVRTERPDSIRLLYPLADPYIPVNLTLDYRSGSPVKGQISLGNFRVEYLRRKSIIEKFQLGMNKPSGVFPVQGRFRVDQAQYKIYIDILGNLKKPQFVLSSDPYLDRSDIISVLLYGRPNDQLVGVDAKTVGSFDAAMADRAIGLIGLWAFASTPIQNFSYNQLTKQYSAQLKVSNDTSLAVGTNWEEATSLELQKRLSDHWMVSASLEPTDQAQQTRKVRLQWEDRF